MCDIHFNMAEATLEDPAPRFGISSGEILFRSELFRSKAANSKLIDGIPDKLVEFLSSGQSKNEVTAYFVPLIDTITKFQATKKAYRLNEIEELKECQKLIQSFEFTNESSFKHEDDYIEMQAVLSRSVDQILTAIVMQYYAILEKQYKNFQSRIGGEDQLVEEATAQAKQSLQMKMFGVYLENETSGKIIFNHLNPATPQFARCCKAAVDNVKSTFFSQSKYYTGLHVMNVFKIENSFLLSKFHKTSSCSKDGKIKGLFCSVPVHSLFHLIAYGFNREKTNSIFQKAWYSIPVNSGSEGKNDLVRSKDFARQLIDSSIPMEFPCHFSRYSTLDSDKENLLNENSNKSEENEIKFLVLCRVIVQKVQVVKELKDIPVSSTFSKETHYISTQEEYLIQQPENVIPEFIVQYKYACSSNTPSQALKTSAVPIIKSNLGSNKISPNSDFSLSVSSIPSQFRATFLPLSRYSGLLQKKSILQGRAGRGIRNSRKNLHDNLLNFEKKGSSVEQDENSMSWKDVCKNSFSQREEIKKLILSTFSDFAQQRSSMYRSKKAYVLKSSEKIEPISKNCA